MRKYRVIVMANQTVLVLDFGGQYKELIARRVRECNVHSHILPGDTPLETILSYQPIGLILTGGPNSVYDASSPKCAPELFSLGVPVLGICYGAQLLCHLCGGKVKSCDVSEYGVTEAEFTKFAAESPLFEGLEGAQEVLMSHTDYISDLPDGFVRTMTTEHCPTAAMENPARKLYAVQFHPEVVHTHRGIEMIHNFLYGVCGAVGDYSMDDYIQRQIEAVRACVGDDQVILGLSGGVDSSVCAALLSKAVPGQLTCIYVDHGFMRKHESEEIEHAFAGQDIRFVRVDASDLFINALAGVADPETKPEIPFALVMKKTRLQHHGFLLLYNRAIVTLPPGVKGLQEIISILRRFITRIIFLDIIVEQDKKCHDVRTDMMHVKIRILEIIMIAVGRA